MKVSAPKQRRDYLEGFLLPMEMELDFFGIGGGRWRKGLTGMHVFFLLQIFQAKQRRQHRETFSFLPPSPPSPFLLGHLNCSPSL